MKTQLMYDAVPEGVPFIPNSAKIVMGYPDGLYQSFVLLVRRFFGRAQVVSIGTQIGNLAEFSDIEPGNPIDTPVKVRADFEHKKAHGVWRPGFYGDETRMANTILPGLSGIPRNEYRLILAKWDGVAKVPAGFDAKQFESLEHYDVSVVNLDTFFPPSAKPKRKVLRVPVPKLHPKFKGATAGTGGGTGIVALLGASGVHLTPTEAGAVVAVLGLIVTWLTPSKS